MSKIEKYAIQQLFETKHARQLITALHGRSDKTNIRVVDAAYWMKGCSSLDRLRYAVLLRVGKNGYKDSGLCLMDIKEATKAAAPRSEQIPCHEAMPNGWLGAREVSPFLEGIECSPLIC